MIGRTQAFIAVLVVLAMSACAPTAPAASSSRAAASQQSATPKQIVAAIFSEPSGLDEEMSHPTGGGSSGSTPGLGEVVTMLDGGLSYVDEKNVLHPWLAEALPSVENGLWTVAPDGTMETTWHLKPGITWHDGTPLTADDLRFTLDVYRERDTGILNLRLLKILDSIEAPDPQTVVAHWNTPYIGADGLFNSGGTMWMLPRHILEQPFNADKETFLSNDFWREKFVGAGPFKMQEWSEGRSITMTANDAYVLGRPQIDRIEVQFFGDREALMAALLSGAVQVPIGRGLYLDQGLHIREVTKDIKVDAGNVLGGVLPVYPQMLTPDPTIVGNVQFRRALFMAIDRKEMTDTLNKGLGPVADSWVQPDWPEGKAVEASIVKYKYDPRAAAQMIESLGYTKGADGVYQDASGTKLSVQVMTHEQNALHGPGTLAVVDYWQHLGLDAQPDILPAVRAHDRKYRAEYPSFSLMSKGVLDPDAVFRSSAVPTAEDHYTGGNVARYGSPELDDLINLYERTIPFTDRMKALGQMVHLQSDQVTIMPLFFQGQALVLGSTRVENVLPDQVWNAHQWKLKE